MRTTINHTPPANQQPLPLDNTSRDVTRQVTRWGKTGQPVNVQIAMEIASWWQSPGNDGIRFAEFASTGTITDGIHEDITREMANLPDYNMGDREAYQELCALGAYITRATPGTN